MHDDESLTEKEMNMFSEKKVLNKLAVYDYDILVLAKSEVQ